jgi:putative membrane protein
MRKFIPIVASIALLSTTALAQDKASQKFLTEAIQGNLAEINMGELAQKNGQAAEVKAFGQMLATDHGAALQNAKEVATSLGVAPPTSPNAKQKADYDKMVKIIGASFDKEFAKHMVMDHEKDIAAYQRASKTKDAAGEYAQRTLPTLRKHLETAHSIQKQPSRR